MKQYKIIFIGPQGSGKGTQAELISKKLGLSVITPGNIFRKEKADGTELGRLAGQYIDQGILVPDEITNKIVKRRLALPEHQNGFIFDGYPRNTVQADALDAVTRLTHVIEIAIPDTESIKRIAKRTVCKNGHIYHTTYQIPKQSGICDIDGEPLYQREDDHESAIKKRLAVYHKDTKPLIGRYKTQGIHYYIDGTGDIADVHSAILRIFA